MVHRNDTDYIAVAHVYGYDTDYNAAVVNFYAFLQHIARYHAYRRSPSSCCGGMSGFFIYPYEIYGLFDF